MKRATLITILCLAPISGMFFPTVSAYVSDTSTLTVTDTILSASVLVDGCSGTAIEWQGKKYIVGASHCFEVGQLVSYTTGDRLKGGTGVVVAVAPALDLALIEVRPEDLTATVEVAEELPEGAWAGCGYPKGKGPTVWSGEFLGAERITNLPRHRWAFKLETGRFKHGNSGSGVFRGGKLVGVAAHMNDKEGVIYACPLHDLRSFLARAVQGRPGPRPGQDGPSRVAFAAGNGPGENWGDKDRTREILALKAQLKSLKAGTGEPGPPGPAGPPGPGMDPAQLSQILERLESLEDWTKNFRATVKVRVHPKESTQ